MIKKLFAFILIAALMALAIPASAGPNDKGKVVSKQCYADDYGRWCQTVWRSDNGVIERGHWTWESSDGTNSSRG